MLAYFAALSALSSPQRWVDEWSNWRRWRPRGWGGGRPASHTQLPSMLPCSATVRRANAWPSVPTPFQSHSLVQSIRVALLHLGLQLCGRAGRGRRSIGCQRWGAGAKGLQGIWDWWHVSWLMAHATGELGTQRAAAGRRAPSRAPAPGHPLTQEADTAVSATATLLAMLCSSGEAWQRTSGRLEPGLAPRRAAGRALSADGACAEALMLLSRVRCQLRGARRLRRWMVRLQLEAGCC